MNLILVAVLAMVTVGALGFALVPAAMGGGRAEQRRKALQGDIRVNRAETDAARNRDQRRKQPNYQRIDKGRYPARVVKQGVVPSQGIGFGREFKIASRPE